MFYKDFIHLLFELTPLAAGIAVTTYIFKSSTLDDVDSGWKYVITGMILLNLGLFVDIIEDFVFIDGEYVIFRTFLEAIVGDFLGFIFLLIGLKKWLPRILNITKAHKELTETHNKLIEKINSKSDREEQFRNQFLDRVSHDLRTPLNGIIGCVEIILGMDVTREQKKYLQEANRSSDDLLKAINSMLELKDDRRTVKSHFKLRRLLNELYNDKLLNYNRSKRSIKMIIDSRVPNNIYASYDLIKSLFSNLLECLYSIPGDGEVFINFYSGLLEGTKTTLNTQIALEDSSDYIDINNPPKKLIIILETIHKLEGEIKPEKADINKIFNISLPVSVYN